MLKDMIQIWFRFAETLCLHRSRTLDVFFLTKAALIHWWLRLYLSLHSYLILLEHGFIDAVKWTFLYVRVKCPNGARTASLVMVSTEVNLSSYLLKNMLKVHFCSIKDRPGSLDVYFCLSGVWRTLLLQSSNARPSSINVSKLAVLRMI